MKPSLYLRVLGEDYARLFLCDDGNKYVVKFHRAKHYRKREVVNEYVAGRLAQLLYLPTSSVHIVDIPSELLRTVPKVKGSRIQGTIHLALRYVEGACSYKELESEIYDFQLTNRHQLADFIAFDLWVANLDRSRSNLLMINHLPKCTSFHMIDHGKCFPGDYLWDEQTLLEQPAYRFDMPVYKWAWKHCTLGELYESVRKICAINEKDIRNVLQDIPREWEVSEIEKQALQSFLQSQKEKLNDIMESFISFHHEA